MGRHSDRDKNRELSILAPSSPSPLGGHDLVVALSRSRDDIEVRDRYGLKKLLSPAEAIQLVCGTDRYVGYGSKRRIRSIAYQPPAPVVVKISDSGMFNFNRYPLAHEETSAHRYSWERIAA